MSLSSQINLNTNETFLKNIAKDIKNLKNLDLEFQSI